MRISFWEGEKNKTGFSSSASQKRDAYSKVYSSNADRLKKHKGVNINNIIRVFVILLFISLESCAPASSQESINAQSASTTANASKTITCVHSTTDGLGNSVLVTYYLVVLKATPTEQSEACSTNSNARSASCSIIVPGQTVQFNFEMQNASGTFQATSATEALDSASCQIDLYL